MALPDALHGAQLLSDVGDDGPVVGVVAAAVQTPQNGNGPPVREVRPLPRHARAVAGPTALRMRRHLLHGFAAYAARLPRGALEPHEQAKLRGLLMRSLGPSPTMRWLSWLHGC